MSGVASAVDAGLIVASWWDSPCGRYCWGGNNYSRKGAVVCYEDRTQIDRGPVYVAWKKIGPAATMAEAMVIIENHKTGRARDVLLDAGQP